MEMNLILMIIIAIIMSLVTGFFDALVKEVNTGIYDYGYLAAMFIYSIFVGVFSATTGLIDLSMPFTDWWTVLGQVALQYFVYLTIMHSVADYIIAKVWTTQTQGLATPFFRSKEKLQTLSMKR